MTDLEYDFFTKQDVKICVDKKDKTQYRVKILTNNPIIFYQVWQPNGKNNSTRFANEALINNFVKLFLDYNLENTIKYSPTTVIEIDNTLHVLVMTNVELDKKGRTVFYFKKNSVEIRNKIQPINSTLPIGIFNNVRFDIDSVSEAMPLSSSGRPSPAAGPVPFRPPNSTAPGRPLSIRPAPARPALD
jgi:hypothetical protein